MSDLKPGLNSKFERQPDGPPPPPKKRKNRSANAEIVASMVGELSTEKAENQAGTDSTDGTASQLEIALDGDLVEKVQTVQPGGTVQSVQTVSTPFVRKHIKQTFKFHPDEALMLKNLAYEHRMTMTDIVRMGILMAKVELEQRAKLKEK